MRYKKPAALILVLTLFLVIGGLAMLSIFSPKPTGLGLSAGQLSPCPNSSNCVSTYASDERHQIEPIRGVVMNDENLQLAIAALKNMGGVVKATKQDYVYAVFTSSVFRFRDDVELHFDRDRNELHFRSASRVGRSDMGANRRRMERFRELFQQQL